MWGTDLSLYLPVAGHSVHTLHLGAQRGQVEVHRVCRTKSITPCDHEAGEHRTAGLSHAAIPIPTHQTHAKTTPGAGYVFTMGDTVYEK